jgi:hypothetical protein
MAETDQTVPVPCPVQLPPINNDLISVNSFMALNHIKNLAPNVSSDFMLEMYNKFIERYSKGLPTVFSFIQAPSDVGIVQQVIGAGGHYFKLTTINTGVDFIWHDRTQNVFLFWGPNNYRVTRALNAISWRIRKITERSQPILIDDDTDYSDMPGLISYDDLI